MYVCASQKLVNVCTPVNTEQVVFINQKGVALIAPYNGILITSALPWYSLSVSGMITDLPMRKILRGANIDKASHSKLNKDMPEADLVAYTNLLQDKYGVMF